MPLIVINKIEQHHGENNSCHLVCTKAIVVSYYWHFVDVVWIALFAAIYLIK